jgi:chemotaxis family two-component system sensor kinase Cph1
MKTYRTASTIESVRGEGTQPAPIDLSNCEREQIHIPGAIQPHGILFALDDVHLRIMHISENTSDLLGVAPRDLLGRSVEDVVGAGNLALLIAAIERDALEELNPLAMEIDMGAGPLSVDAILHRTGDVILLELEPADVSLAVTFHRFYQSVRGSITRFDATRTVQALCDIVVDEVSGLTGFDRVMVYRFDLDWHGEVIAETCDAGISPFLGLHFPASDIPRQARDLFTRSWLRYIADVNYHPAAIIRSDVLAGSAPLDLSDSVLRSVSPVHIEYLQNMGVGATMTVSLLKAGKLWGLIACHHRTPKLVPYQVRIACEVIGRTMSLHLGSDEENEDIEHRMKLKSVQVQLLAALSNDPDIARTLASTNPSVLELVDAAGAAIRYGDECRLVGRTPELADVIALTDWLHEIGSEEVFATDALATVAPQFERIARTASGIIALPLSRVARNYVVWFRPEVISTVSWGGNPAKPVEAVAGGARIAPRTSFELWRETVRLHALPWKTYEIDAARELRHVIGSIIVERAEELVRVNRELARSNTELNSFAHVASHDLREPLRGIHNYASYLLEDYGAVVDDAGREKLETLIRLSQRMDQLIQSHLQLSRVGEGRLVGRPTNLAPLVDELIAHLPSRLGAGSITLVSALPTVLADEIGMREVFDNLLSNAMKYSDGPAQIDIGVAEGTWAPSHRPPAPAITASLGAFVTLFVRDGGIGIRAKHLDIIFNMFKRLHATDRYGGGTGAGLAIVKKIIERCNGQIWAESTHGVGTTFFFTLPLGT